MAYLTRQTQEDSDRNSTWGMLPMSCSCRAYDFTTRLIWERGLLNRSQRSPQPWCRLAFIPPEQRRGNGPFHFPFLWEGRTARITPAPKPDWPQRCAHLSPARRDLPPVRWGGGGAEKLHVYSCHRFCSCRHGGIVWFSHWGFKFGTSETWVHR